MTRVAKDEKRFTNPVELAKEWGVTPETVRSHIANGALPAYRLGKLFKIERADAETFLESSRAHAAAR